EERWTRSIVPAPKPEDDPGYADAKADALRDMEHHYAARRTAGYTDEEWEHHLRAHHGYDDRSIHRNLEAGNRLGDLHAAIHDAGLASHPDHTEPSVPRSEEIASQFGKPVIPSYHNRAVRPENGGAVPRDPMISIIQSEPSHGVLPEDRLSRDRANAYYSMLRQAGIRVKVHGPDDFSFSHAADEDTDEDNSLETGDPGETSQEDSEDPANSLDEGVPDGGEGSPDEEPGGEEAPEEDAGHLPAGIAPKPAIPKGPPNVPQAAGSPSMWPLATATVQESPLPMSQGGQPSPSTRRNVGNPMKLQLPGQDGGEGPDEDGAEDSGKPPKGG